MHTTVEDVVYCYDYELSELADMVRSGKMPHSYEDMIKPVELLAAIEQSYTENKKVELKW